MSLERPQDEGWINGPTVFAIAWIPKRKYYGHFPAGLWNHRHWYSWAGMMGLTGNEPPPIEFQGLEGLNQFVKTKAYRAIVGFRDVKLATSLDAEGRCRIERTKLHVGGYTPIMNLRHSRGEIATIESESSAPQFGFANIQNDIEFRVGRRLNFMHKLMTCHRLPHASMTVHYSLGFGGDHEIVLSSTNIPNVTLYLDWKAVETYSIDTITVAQAEDFVTAYSRTTAAEENDRFTITCRPGETPEVSRGGPPPPDFST